MRNRNLGPRWTIADGVECSVDPLDVLDQYRSLARTYNGTLRSGDRSAAVAFHVAAEVFTRTLKGEMRAGEQAQLERTVADMLVFLDKVVFEAQAERLATQRKGRA